MNAHLTAFLCILIFLVGIPIATFVWRFFGFPRKGQNKYFRDADGRILLFRGVNVCNSAKWNPDYLPWHTEKEYSKLVEHGFNVVRFLIFWEAIEPEESKENAAYLRKVKEHLAILDKLGIKVILDIHQDLYNRKFTGNGFPDWALPNKEYPFTPQKKWFMNYLQKAVVESYKYFWKSDRLKKKYIEMVMFVQSYFNDASNVVSIDVMNEPFPALPSLPLFERNTLTEFYRCMRYERDGLKSAGKNHNIPLFVEPAIWTSSGVPSGLTSGDKLSKLFYIPHYYPPFCHYEGTYNWFNKFLMKIALRSKAREAQKTKSPYIIGEFGISVDVKKRLSGIRDFIDHSNKYHMNWCWWSYDKMEHSTQGLMDNDGNPNVTMMALTHAYPQKIAGINPVFELKNNSFVIEFTDDIGYKVPTEIYVPGKIFSVETSNMSCNYDSKALWQVMKFYSNEKGKHRISITWRSS